MAWRRPLLCQRPPHPRHPAVPTSRPMPGGLRRGALVLVSGTQNQWGEATPAPPASSHLFSNQPCPSSPSPSFFPPPPPPSSYSGFLDELAWASLWLHRATGTATYLDKARAVYDSCCSYAMNRAFTWDDQAPGVQLLMYKHTGTRGRTLGEGGREGIGGKVSEWGGRERGKE